MLNVTETMKHLHRVAKRHPKEQVKRDLFKLMTYRIWLGQAWEEIRRNKGSQTALNRKAKIPLFINLLSYFKTTYTIFSSIIALICFMFL